jgi:hypothetical protein
MHFPAAETVGSIVAEMNADSEEEEEDKDVDKCEEEIDNSGISSLMHNALN